MPSAIATSPRYKFFDANGNPAADYLLYTYAAGSLTPKTTWKNQDQSTANTNPIVLDAVGECLLWLEVDQEYKFVLKTPGGSIINTTDDITGSDSGLRRELSESSGAGMVGFLQTGDGSVTQTVQDVLRERVSVANFGAKGDNATDNALAFALVKAQAEAGVPIHIPKGIYLTSQPLAFTSPVNILADPGVRIKLTAGSGVEAVLKIDLTGGAGAFGYGANVENLILDGAGHSLDGMLLKGVISSTFRNIRATNVTRSGLHLAWAQCCTFDNVACSNNIEAFTTTPSNGILIDGATSSANTFINPVIEHVSGSGIFGISAINNVFINGTSEGNVIGIEFGEAVEAGRTCIGNTIIGMDLEVNSAADIALRLTASANTFIGLSAGYSSPEVQILSSHSNVFLGGVTGGFALTAASHDNRIDSVKILGAGRTITDSGTRNTWRGLYNISTATVIADSGVRSLVINSVPNGTTMAINAATTSAVVGVATGPAFTVGAPSNPVDGMLLDVTVRNESLGAVTITWNAAFKIAGWVSPANAFSRTARFMYMANYNAWVCLSITAADIPN